MPLKTTSKFVCGTIQILRNTLPQELARPFWPTEFLTSSTLLGPARLLTRVAVEAWLLFTMDAKIFDREDRHWYVTYFS